MVIGLSPPPNFQLSILEPSHQTRVPLKSILLAATRLPSPRRVAVMEICALILDLLGFMFTDLSCQTGVRGRAAWSRVRELAVRDTPRLDWRS